LQNPHFFGTNECDGDHVHSSPIKLGLWDVWLFGFDSIVVTTS